MTIFEVVCADYLIEETHILEHNNKSEKEFNEDFRKSLVEVGNDYINSTDENEWVTTCGWIKNAVYFMVSVYGYRIISPITFLYTGSIIIQSENKKWKKLVGDILFNKAAISNKRLAKSFRDEVKNEKRRKE